MESSNNGKINAIDVATPYAGYRDNANAYRAVGVVLESAVVGFLSRNCCSRYLLERQKLF